MVAAATEYVDAWKASELVRSGPTAGKGQKVKAAAGKKAAGKKAGAAVARKAVKQAVQRADTAAKSARKGAGK